MEIRSGASANGHDAIHSNGNGSANLPLNWEHLARATAHPLRISILEILGMEGGRTLSPSELSQELQIPLSNTNYHVTELAKAGLIELTHQQQVRGATEHFYRIPTSTPAESRFREKATQQLAAVPMSQAQAA
jgi:predicted transcriptional regulator